MGSIPGRIFDTILLIQSRFMAKELFSDDAMIDLSKCDIFSLGLTVFCLCSGQILEPDGEVWHQLRAGRLTFPNFFPSALLDILTHMTASDPLSRPSALMCIQSYTVLMSPQEKQLKEQIEKIKLLEKQLELLGKTTTPPTLAMYDWN